MYLALYCWKEISVIFQAEITSGSLIVRCQILIQLFPLLMVSYFVLQLSARKIDLNPSPSHSDSFPEIYIDIRTGLCAEN